MAQILMDALSHQAIRENGSEADVYGDPLSTAGRWRGKRLTGLRASLDAAGHRLSIAHLHAGPLAKAQLLIVASRSQKLPFSAAELDNIREFVAAGGALWLMANHRLFVAPQQQLVDALALPLKLNDVSISNYPLIDLRPHSTTEGCERFHVRNASSIFASDQAEAVAVYSADPRHAFAVVSDTATGRGRVLVTADSGFIASLDDAGQRMFESGGNARFFANSVTWLLGQPALATGPAGM